MKMVFSNRMWHWRGPSPFHFISLPEDLSQEIKDMAASLTYGWGMIPVNARIGQTEFSTAMYEKNGVYILPIKNVVRLGEKIEIDDMVDVEISLKPQL